MLTKEIQYYTYINQPSTKVIIKSNTLTNKDNFNSNTISISSLNNTPNSLIQKRYEWKTKSDKEPSNGRYVDINFLTGNLASTGKDEEMSVMLKTPSIITDTQAISYGFYDASYLSVGGLTDKDQAYIYVTENKSNWMGSLINQYPNAKFNQLVLAGAHNAGMFTIKTVQELIQDNLIGEVLSLIQGLNGLVEEPLERVITDFYMTQKDDISTALDLGVRYFDFRPGYLYSVLKAHSNELYHQHTNIPGYSYMEFLKNVLQWLDQHPKEIVVVNCNTQGFADDKMKPTAETLDNYLSQARTAVNIPEEKIAIGTKNNFNDSLSELCDRNIRLIFLNQIDNDTSDKAASKYDSYSDAAYATLSPEPVINALSEMNSTEQIKYDYTVLQLQATATAVDGVVPDKLASALSNSDASSPLLSTKAGMDQGTFPWLLNNVNDKLFAAQLIVLLNDFVGPGTVDIAQQLTSDRLEKVYSADDESCQLSGAAADLDING